MPDFSFRRVVLEELPFQDFVPQGSTYPWEEVPQWPCSWVHLIEPPTAPFVAAYRLKFHLEASRSLRVHVSGDERYEFFVDGERVGRGPTRSPLGRWHYESYELELGAGEHIFAARVHTLGNLAPWAQTTYKHGWLLAPEPEDLWQLLGTGNGLWEGKVLSGYSFTSPWEQLKKTLGCGPTTQIDGNYLQAIESDDNWVPVTVGYAGNNGVTLYYRDDQPLLYPTPIPPSKSELQTSIRVRDVWHTDTNEPFPLQFTDRANEPALWSSLLNGQSLTLGENQKWRVLFDFEDYISAFPALSFSGGEGATVRLGWSEALVDEEGKKGNRSQVAGRHWFGLGDTFLPSGTKNQLFEPLWWRCGRYLLLEVETGAQPLVLENLTLEKTGYPLDAVAQWQCSELSWHNLFVLCQRSLESCMHETYMDCPFYEQLQYLGDTRLQMLLTYVLSGDDRLARQALTAFAIAQRNPTQWMPSNHPSRVGQCIPPFTLWWVGMLHDFGRWRGDQPFVKSLLPTARSVVELWLQNRQDEGLVETPKGWNFVEAVGHLVDAKEPFHGALNWHLAYTLRHLGELEAWCGEPELASRWHRLAHSLAQACEQFWNPQRQLYADDLEHTLLSEHTNCLALLSELLSAQRQAQLEASLFSDDDMARCSIYFSHYLFEAAAQAERVGIIEQHLPPWLELAPQGFVTTPEVFGQTRSDCHAWGAHPLYHYYASILGITPASWGFETVNIAPRLGSLSEARGVMSHPKGVIEVEWKHEDNEIVGQVTLPDGISGSVEWRGRHRPLVSGKQSLRVAHNQ